MTYTPSRQHAPDGHLWVCLACGKTSVDPYGDRGSGWDESCAISAYLYPRRALVMQGNRCVRILEEPEDHATD